MFRSCDEREEEQQRAATREEEEEEEEAKRALLPPPRRTEATAAALADIVALICGVRVSCLFFILKKKKEESPQRKIFLSQSGACNLHKNLQSSLLCRAARERYLHTFLSLSLNLHRAARVLRKTHVFIKKYLYKKEREADDDDAA